MGQVNLVLIMSIDQTSPEISFQMIILDPATYYTSCAEESLDIKFKEMFRRPPTALEHNIQISVDWLERIASII